MTSKLIKYLINSGYRWEIYKETKSVEEDYDRIGVYLFKHGHSLVRRLEEREILLAKFDLLLYTAKQMIGELEGTK